MATPSRKSAGPDGSIKANNTNWAQVEAEYRVGIRSLRDIAEDAGITEGAIRKRAKRDQWERDLKARINARAEEKVRTQAVRVPGTQLTPKTEYEVVEANADAQYVVRISHRAGLQKLKELKDKLLTRVEQDSENHREAIDDLRKLAEIDEKIRKGEREAHSITGDAESAAGAQKRVLLEFVDAVTK